MTLNILNLNKNQTTKIRYFKNVYEGENILFLNKC